VPHHDVAATQEVGRGQRQLTSANLAGFDPGAGLRSASGLATLGFLYAGLPIVLKLAAIAMMWNFPLDEVAQATLRAKIEAAR
jgi:Na+/melibiose symporter-like transporter